MVQNNKSNPGGGKQGDPPGQAARPPDSDQKPKAKAKAKDVSEAEATQREGSPKVPPARFPD